VHVCACACVYSSVCVCVCLCLHSCVSERVLLFVGGVVHELGKQCSFKWVFPMLAQGHVFSATGINLK
jgi:hypothetical protein